MTATAIAFTMYPVSDVPRAVAFYRDGLGLPQAGIEAEWWVEFEVGGGTFGVGNFEQVGVPGSAQSLALEIADLNGFRAALSERGIESSEPHELAVCRISVVRDPDGNQVWLHQSKPR
jgi:catechol 2,3-dioxygenase-like lactoylglutathione lyase family enzyme